jgi:hypothetical protein
LAAVAAYADGALSSGNAVPAVTSRPQAALASLPTDRGRVGTHGISTSTPPPGSSAWVAPDAEKPASYGLHPRLVQKDCYPLKMVEVYLDVSCYLFGRLVQLLPVGQAQFLIRDEKEPVNRRLLALSLLKVSSELALDLRELLLSSRKVHGCQASEATLRAQDVLPAVRPSIGVAWINVLVAIE